MKVKLDEFINQTISDINKGLPDGWEVNQEIHFEVSLISEAKAGGKVDIKVVNLGANIDYREIQYVNFSVVNSKNKERNESQQVHNAKEIMGSIITLGKPKKQIRKKKPNS
jgi:hypothetical protein